MKFLEVGVHRIDAPSLLLESTGVLASNTVAVSRFDRLVQPSLSDSHRQTMTKTQVGNVETMRVPKLHCQLPLAFAEHLTAMYSMGPASDLFKDKDQAQLLWCQGASFHEDGVFDCVLAVMLWEGAPRDLVLPHLGVAVRMLPGTVVLMDCAQPHGLLLPGDTTFQKEKYEDESARSIFLTMDLPRYVTGLEALMKFDTDPVRLPPSYKRIRGSTTVDERSGMWVEAKKLN